MNLSIDITRLEKVRRRGSKITARCPACAAAGNDRHGDHLYLNLESGKFGCAALPGDSEHRREIFALVGIKTARDPDEERQWRLDRAKESRLAIERRKVSAAVRAKRAEIIAAHRWTRDEIVSSSPLEPTNDPRQFIAALFTPGSLVWTGAVNQSGRNYSSRWQTVEAWQAAPSHTVGPMISPATWKPGTTSRSAANVECSPFVVLDFDGFDGRKPVTSDELRAHIAASLAITRWMREALSWKLAALLYTGSKSIHAWFHTPPPAALDSLRHTAEALGVDAGLIGRAEHPCRLPGWVHEKTGKPSRVLWIQGP